MEIKTNNYGKGLLAVFHRRLSSAISWLQSFIALLNNSTYDRMIFLGNFNLPEVSWIKGTGFCDSDQSTLFTFCDDLVSKNMFQMIESATRKNNILDLLITSMLKVCLTSM